ncbi:MAG TPA: alkane 1-monooxygenase [Bacteroidetes bacterium]|nr:alkane 1-monooxygenase [Bacteroidota bacterium]
MSPWRYLIAYTIPALVYWTMFQGGNLTWLPVFYVFLVIPLADLFVGRDASNLTADAEVKAKASNVYTFILWMFIPVQFGLIITLGYLYTQELLSGFALLGAMLSIALSNGGIGITIAHELVHRSNKFEQILGRILLLSVLYMHFAIEHVRGHHATVATDEDPASAKKGQSFYGFLLPSIFGQYISAWQLESERLSKLKMSNLSLKNEMIQFSLAQIAFSYMVFNLFGLEFLIVFFTVSFLSFSLLEAVNYLEHYGLEREKKPNGRYEKVTHHHSWNSDHILSRMFLFELTRHSDHHAVASRKYQILRTFEDSPQLPTGYPGMILLALIPPLWFRVMDPLIEKSHSTAS